MATHTVSLYSPSKTRLSASLLPARKIQPSPEKDALTSIAVIKRSSSTTEAGSPIKKRKGDYSDSFVQDAQLQLKAQGNESVLPQLHSLVQTSRHIQLSLSLNSDQMPSLEELRGLTNLFPTTFGVDVELPFVVFRVRTIPPKPWPLTVGGVPVWFTTEAFGGTFYKGAFGRAHKILEDMDLRKKKCPMKLLDKIISIFKEMKVRVLEILWCFGWFRIAVEDKHDMKDLPALIAHCPAYYRKASEVEQPDASAIRNRVPDGTVIDTTSYLTPTDLLRPGILLGSSNIQGQWLSTTSGILVADTTNEVYLTVSSHGFRSDGLVYHPEPSLGQVIGQIDRIIPGLDISLVKLNEGLTYINETFGDGNNAGDTLSSIAVKLNRNDLLTMNSPYTGACEGVLLGTGIRIEGAEEIYVGHHWYYTQSGIGPVDGCCGTPVLNENCEVIGLFRCMYSDGSCYAVAAHQVREVGLEIVGGKYTF